MSIIPEPLRSQIEEAASKSSNMGISNNDDPADDDPLDESSDEKENR